MNRIKLTAASIGFICLAAACGSEAKGGGGDRPQLGPEHLDPSQFVQTIDNPYLPLEPGTTWEYTAVSSDSEERIVVTVLDETKVVDGVTATVVHDRVTEMDGSLVEDTYDWFAQDTKGNVWYLGEATKAYDGDKVSTSGSWEAGVDGARAGIFMLAEPTVGTRYQQEYYKGQAEDAATVLSLNMRAKVPSGAFDHLLTTREHTPLEPRVQEHKFYAKGVGHVLAITVSGGSSRQELISFKRGA